MSNASTATLAKSFGASPGPRADNIPFDLYLLRFPNGTEIPPHRDPVTGRRHFRLNVILKRPRAGGEFKCESPIFETKRIKLFRSDISVHSVTKVEGGSRYVLSLGWVLK